ncbi:LysR family transcriptional regulator [Chondromyces crocatus]|uniref:LysR family transcriptional regulator n=1 Tax=Chondromyces crocatus TaxID=52 RepID=A0A0K1EF45_CHOCO|nr:LysR family transcriptional regulator [Chondromyces crocatus]AKT39474.1 LysR family transcriptional regulator [Chondromyces crocatus]
MNDPAETSEMLAFCKAVASESLSRAAAELGVPRATVSRRLARLEERLGVRLLRRTTRSLTLTEAGEAFYRHARIALDAVASAEASVRRVDDVIRGALRVSLPFIDDASFDAMICDFKERHPEVRLHLETTTRIIDLHRDGYDVAIRASGALEPGLVARGLVRFQGLAVASPAYLAAHGTPRTARDLRRHRCLLGFVRGELPQMYWPLRGGGKVQVEGTFSANDVELLCHAAIRGLGIAFLPQSVASEALAAGALVQVLAGVVGNDMQVAVVYPEREFVPPQVRAFVDAVIAWAPSSLMARTPRGSALASRGREAQAAPQRIEPGAPVRRGAAKEAAGTTPAAPVRRGAAKRAASAPEAEDGQLVRRGGRRVRR